MGSVNDDGVDPGLDQGCDTLFRTHTDAHGSGHTQAAFHIAGCVGERGLFIDVFDGDEALELKRIVDHQQALQLVLVQQCLGLGGGRTVFLVDGDEFLAWRHDLADLDVVARFKPHITAGNDANDLPRITHRKARNTEIFGQFENLQHGVLRCDDHRVIHHSRLVALDLRHFRRLLLGRHVFVDHPNAALLRDGDSQTCFCDGVHSSGHKGEIEGDVAREARGERGVLRQDLGVRRHQQHVVEGERFSKKAHELCSKKRIVPAPQNGCARYTEAP